VAGLNPHCGEGGLFGSEDDQEIAPAVAAARAEGIAAEGPLPADTVFSKMRGGMYDLVVVMYHDQGHIPTKLMGFQYDDRTGTWGQMAGVNVTLGLPSSACRSTTAPPSERRARAAPTPVHDRGRQARGEAGRGS